MFFLRLRSRDLKAVKFVTFGGRYGRDRSQTHGSSLSDSSLDAVLVPVEMEAVDFTGSGDVGSRSGFDTVFVTIRVNLWRLAGLTVSTLVP